VQIGKGFHSCCVVVKNMQRCIYAIPNSSVFPRDTISRTEKNSTSSDALPSLRATLHVRDSLFHTILNAHCSTLILYAYCLSSCQELASGLKSEVADKLSDLNISNFVMTPVKVCRQSLLWEAPCNFHSCIFCLSELTDHIWHALEELCI
jgi:DNA polymerase alpha subunit A